MEPPPDPASAPGSEAPHDTGIPIAVDDPLPARPAMRECPGCARPIAGDSVTCAHCGYSLSGGAPEPPAGVKCRHCGYDLTGLKSPRCPECGKLHVPRRFVGHGEEISRQVARWEYLKPTLMIAICLPLAAVVNWFFDGRDETVAMLLGIAVQIPVATVVFLGCCVLWIGFDAPIHLTVLRIAGILSAVALASELAEEIKIVFVPTALTVAVYVGLLAEMLDMDFPDAAIVAILTYFAGLGVWMWLVYAMGW